MIRDHNTDCFKKAALLVEGGFVKLTNEMDIMDLTDLIIKLEQEKEFKNSISDKSLDYNDAIISIEDVGVLDTIDISVSGDNLFYCSDILTKNSFGLPATADFMFALIATEELDALNQIMVKQLKNRYNDPTVNKRFVIGIDRTKMKLYDVENSAQTDIIDSGQSASTYNSAPKNKFKNLKV
jgi:hypothetical protein